MQQNVRRVNKHPSVAQWAGGNEIEGIVTTVNQTVANGTAFLDQASLLQSYVPRLPLMRLLQYVALFQDFLWDVTYQETKSASEARVLYLTSLADVCTRFPIQTVRPLMVF